MIGTAIVVGGGIGGLACATALARRGVAVTLYERAPEIREVGAGLQVSPNGLAVLRALGLETALLDRGAVAAEAVVLADYKAGREVARLDLRRLRDQTYLFVHRHDLVSVLAQAARDAGVALQLGQAVTAIAPGATPRLTRASGEDADAEVIICADGIHSVGRPAVSPGSRAAFTGQVAWRATVPARDPAPEVRVSMGPGRHVVSYPLRGGSMMNLVAVEEREAWADEGWHHEDDPDVLRDVFADFGGPVADLLAKVQQVSRWGLFRHPVAERWMHGNVALLGDAAHPTLPFLAQGANLALEDAWVLAACLAAGTAAEQYQSVRRTRAVKVIDAASTNAWKYHLRHGPVRQLAHLGLSLGSRIAPGLMMRQFDWVYGHDVTAR
ncbi:FAD-dependent monooxygenase [Roseobacter sinensis]|uniref:FAD-dependent monooxygenase n=1 Tax=Roseobacter sinensis TaxID=2931391 RepID=A0ABT3BBS8_9RHOB|nr:FAD-dependent monooxygenase [Roseobacter sp. WL0113]MCV3271015.1 FAD-dependent monooxygenase [Roseobacter sp. WL0113]